jgi:cell division protein ZapB
MTQPSSYQPPELIDLEDKLERLFSRYQAMKNENSLLKRQQQELLEEKSQLLEKTELAKARIETLIERLKAMEQGS